MSHGAVGGRLGVLSVQLLGQSYATKFLFVWFCFLLCFRQGLGIKFCINPLASASQIVEL